MEPAKTRRYSWADTPTRRYSIHGPDDIWRLFYKTGGPRPKPKKKYISIEKLLADKKWEEEKSEISKYRDVDLTLNIWRKIKEDILDMQTRLLATQNPRYCTRPPKIFKALRIFELKTTDAGALTYVLLDPPVIQFFGYEPGGRYLAQLEILNMSPWSQTLRVIKPQTSSYMMESDEFPFQGKLLGPGTCSHLTVIFVPGGVAIPDDCILVKTEMDRLCIRLVAHQPLPAVFSIPRTVDLGHCLVGHVTSGSFAVTAMGAGAAFRLLLDCQSPSPSDHRSPGVELIYVCHNILFFPPFVAYPCALELQAEETGNVIVLFRPSVPGKFCATVKLVTGTGLEWETTISGIADNIAVDFGHIDGRRLRPGELDLGLWIGQVVVSSSTQRELTVANSSSVSYRYFWKLKRNPPKVDDWKLASDIVYEAYDKEAFSMVPPSGVLRAGSEMPTSIKFAPADVLVYKYHASLYLDTRHCNSQHLEDPWTEFVEMLDMLEAKLRLTGGKSPWKYQNAEKAKLYFSGIRLSAMESKGGIFKVLEFDLMGSGSPFDVQMIPPLVCSSGVLMLGKYFQHQVFIRNNGESTILFAWELHPTPLDENHVSVSPVMGEVEAMSAAEVCVTVRARKIGQLHQKVCCRLEDLKGTGFILTLEVDGFVEGPVVTIEEPMLAFGIVQVKKQRTLEIQLTNQSTVAAAFQICFTAPCPPMVNKTPLAMPGFCNLVRLDNMHCLPGEAREGLSLTRKAPLRQDFLLKMEDALQQSQGVLLPYFDLMGGEPVATHVISKFTNMDQPCPEIKPEPPLTFEPSAGFLTPYDTTTVNAVFKPLVCGNFYCTITCVIEGGLSPSQYAVATAEVVAPRACLTPSLVDTGTIYVDVPVSRNITLRNISALPVFYSWAVKGIGDVTAIDVRVLPREGMLPPFQNLQVELRMNPNIQGNFEYIAFCDIQDMDASPIGVNITGYICDVCVSYFVTRLATIKHLTSSEWRPKYDGKVGWKQRGVRCSYEALTSNSVDTSIPVSIPCLDFGRRCSLGVVHSLRLTIRNDSAVTSKVHVHVGKYGARETQPYLAEEVLVLSYLTGRLLSFPPTAVEFHGGLRGRPKKSPIIGTFDELHNLYSSSSGWAMLSRRVEQNLRDTLVEHGCGVCFLTYPSGQGVLGPWAEWNCEVVCFSCLPGFFSDVLYCKVGPLDIVQVPIEIEIVGTPLTMRRNSVEPDRLFQLTEHSGLSLVWTTMPAGYPLATKTFLVANFSTHAIVVNWERRKTEASRDLVQINMSTEVAEDKILHVLLDSYLDQTDGTVSVSLEYQPVDEAACLAEEMDHVCKQDQFADNSWLYVLMKFTPATKVHVELRDHKEVEGGAGKVNVVLSENSENAEEDCPFTIVPNKQIVQGRGLAKFAVTFCAAEASNYSALLLGNSKFKELKVEIDARSESEHSSRSSGLLVLMDEVDPNAFPLPSEASPTKMDDSLRPRQLQPLVVHAEAILQIPRLVMNIDEKLEFEYAMTGPNDGNLFMVSALLLTNPYRATVTFSIAVAAPFHVIGPLRHGILHSIEHGDSWQLLKVIKDKSPQDLQFTLKPGWTLQLDVKLEIEEVPMPPPPPPPPPPNEAEEINLVLQESREAPITTNTKVPPLATQSQVETSTQAPPTTKKLQAKTTQGAEPAPPVEAKTVPPTREPTTTRGAKPAPQVEAKTVPPTREPAATRGAKPAPQVEAKTVQPTREPATTRGAKPAPKDVVPPTPDSAIGSSEIPEEKKPEVPRSNRVCHECPMTIKFAGLYEQLVPLRCELVFPEVELLTCTLWNAPPATVPVEVPELQQNVGKETKAKKPGKKQESKQSKESKENKSTPSKNAGGNSKSAKGKSGAKDTKAAPEETVPPPSSEGTPTMTPAEDGVFELWFGSVLLSASQTLEITIVNPTIAHAFWELTKDGTKGEPSPVLPEIEPPAEDVPTSPPKSKRIPRPSVHGPYGPWELHKKVGKNPHRPRRRLTAADFFGEGTIPGTRYTMAEEWPLPWGKAHKPSVQQQGGVQYDECKPLPVLQEIEPPAEDVPTSPPKSKRIPRPSVHGPYGPWELHQKVGSNPHRPRRRLTTADFFGEGIIPGTRYTMAEEWPLPWGKARKPSVQQGGVHFDEEDSKDDKSHSSALPDQEPFHFSIVTGMLPGSVPRIEPNKQSILVTFSPMEEIPYKETYHLQVYKGHGFKIRIEGQGIPNPEPEQITEPLDKLKTPADTSVKSKTPVKVKATKK